MRVYLIFIGWVLLSQMGFGQQVDPDLLMARERLDAIASFNADLNLTVDISFVNMPPKSAKMSYQKGEPTTFSSEDFILIPKRGLDFSLSEIFKYPFISVDRGFEQYSGRTCKLLNIIPTDSKADFSIASLALDTLTHQVIFTEINTKKDGAYQMLMTYDDDEQAIPGRVEVSFEIERIRIPLQYMGKEVEVDKSQMKADGLKKGRITLEIMPYDVRLVK
ncbi:MAG: hypothetical protein RIC80_13330 [Cyclobacteriaceae bacterium]